MQEIKSNRTVQLQDLVSCALEPYCNPVAAQGSSNIKPSTNKPKNLATATVSLNQSAFLKGQTIKIALDLAHPRVLHRDPACWIQLIRKESYCAGEYVNLYRKVDSYCLHIRCQANAQFTPVSDSSAKAKNTAISLQLPLLGWFLTGQTILGRNTPM
jgi:hypothetical protein